MLDSNSLKEYPWRHVRYQRFYQVADTIVDEVQNLVWRDTGKIKRRVKGDGLKKLTYSVEKLIRDSLAVVLEEGKIILKG